MKRITSILYFLFINTTAFAQTPYDYMDDSSVAGGADRVLNGFVILFLIIIALLVIILIVGGLGKIKYELSPQKEIDRQKKEKEEQEKQEKIRKEQEHKKTLLALPENTIRLSIKGKPHLVELAPGGDRRHTEMIAICLWTIDRIVWGSTEITDQISYVNKLLDIIYGEHYKSRYDCYAFPNLRELIISKYCADLADKASIMTFEIEFTIRGDFNAQKLQIINYSSMGLRDEISRNIKGLEFVVYDDDVIQTHLVNGKPLCFPRDGYNSYPKFN